ncbi:MAG: class II fructose-bisphosphate aldolase [Candidatus Pacebacteria bacterium]|nr:class II fructose-bisphosphate aldolase [Candidatus Paceibacterota bacterium]
MKKFLWQFNFSTLEQLRAIVQASKGKKIILGTSESESKFFGLEEAVYLTRKSNLLLNLDHGKDIKYIKQAIKIGYDMIHFDGSDLKFKDNIKITKELVKLAHKKGVFLEAEFDPISDKLTDPKKALFFLKQTKADSLAIAVGNRHGKEKVNINFERIREIKRLTGSSLVLHGGSGVSLTELKKAIQSGINKININTELRIIWKQALKQSLKQKDLKPYNLLKPVQEKIKEKVEKYLLIF